MNPLHELAEVLQRNNEQLGQYTTNSWQSRTLHAVRKCRTAELGGHIDQCDNPNCGHIHLSYNSCRNRHCPKCQGHKREEWILAREQELLKVPYFHVVFTLPCELNALCLQSPKLIYGLLFKTAWSVIKGFGANPKKLGAKMGMIAILHTWGQNLSLHPHLHCIVPGGGLAESGRWKYAQRKSKYLFCVKQMSKVFRAQFVADLRKNFTLPPTFYQVLFSKHWVVHCNQPFYGPSQVIEYLARYTHKIAISNHRIKNIENEKVTFSAKDYRKGGKKYDVTLSDQEFIRRFALHVLPKGFVKIRHYGFLSSKNKGTLLKELHKRIGKPTIREKPVLLLNKCRKCKTGDLVTIYAFDQRGPPCEVLKRIKS